jgi:hypothetical protein
MYKKLLIEDGISRRDQVLAQAAFYSGARCGSARGTRVRRFQVPVGEGMARIFFQKTGIRRDTHKNKAETSLMRFRP